MKSEVELTRAQLGVWHEQAAVPSSTAFNILHTVEFFGKLDSKLFVQALQVTLTELPTFHARFVLQPTLRQWLGSSEPLPPLLQDFSHTAQPKEAADAAFMTLDQPFNLQAGELYRHAVQRLGPEHYAWRLAIHHIAVDGYGLSLCIQRLAENYRRLSTGESITHPPFTKLEAVVEAEKNYDTSDQKTLDRAYLQSLYAGIPFTPAPLLQLSLQRGHRISQFLPADLVLQLRKHAHRLNTTWPNVLFALTAVVWAQRTGDSTIFIGLPTMQRLGGVAAYVPSMLMNILPLRVTVQPHSTYNSLILQVRDQLSNLQKHARYRYEELWLELSQRRLFGPETNIIPFATPLDFGPYLQAAASTIASGPVEDLAFNFTGWRHTLCFTLDGHPALYSPQDLATHARHVVTILRCLLEHPDVPCKAVLEAIK